MPGSTSSDLGPNGKLVLQPVHVPTALGSPSVQTRPMVNVASANVSEGVRLAPLRRLLPTGRSLGPAW